MKENLKGGWNMKKRPLYTFTTHDLGKNWFKQKNKKPNWKQASKDLIPSKKNQHYINKSKNC